MTSDRHEIAKRLADAHVSVEPGITQVFELQDPSESESLPDAPIMLLEVNADTSPSGVLPLHFPAELNRGIPYPLVIVEVTPAEFEALKTQSLKLPDGWKIGSMLFTARGNGDSR